MADVDEVQAYLATLTKKSRKISASDPVEGAGGQNRPLKTFGNLRQETKDVPFISTKSTPNEGVKTKTSVNSVLQSYMDFEKKYRNKKFNLDSRRDSTDSLLSDKAPLPGRKLSRESLPVTKLPRSPTRSEKLSKTAKPKSSKRQEFHYGFSDEEIEKFLGELSTSDSASISLAEMPDHLNKEDFRPSLVEEYGRQDPDSASELTPDLTGPPLASLTPSKKTIEVRIPIVSSRLSSDSEEATSEVSSLSTQSKDLATEGSDLFKLNNIFSVDHLSPVVTDDEADNANSVTLTSVESTGVNPAEDIKIQHSPSPDIIEVKNSPLPEAKKVKASPREARKATASVSPEPRKAKASVSPEARKAKASVSPEARKAKASVSPEARKVKKYSRPNASQVKYKRSPSPEESTVKSVSSVPESNNGSEVYSEDTFVSEDESSLASDCSGKMPHTTTENFGGFGAQLVKTEPNRGGSPVSVSLCTSSVSQTATYETTNLENRQEKGNKKNQINSRRTKMRAQSPPGRAREYSSQAVQTCCDRNIQVDLGTKSEQNQPEFRAPPLRYTWHDVPLPTPLGPMLVSPDVSERITSANLVQTVINSIMTQQYSCIRSMVTHNRETFSRLRDSIQPDHQYVTYDSVVKKVKQCPKTLLE